MRIASFAQKGNNLYGNCSLFQVHLFLAHNDKALILFQLKTPILKRSAVLKLLNVISLISSNFR